MRERLSAAEARRVALDAQGFGAQARPAPERALRWVLRHTSLFQIDSVRVLARAHEVPLYSRIGPYDVDAVLYRAANRAPRRLFEYWAHEASYLPVELHPLLRWRMGRARTEAWGGMRRIAEERPELVARVLEEVRLRGPMTAREIQSDEPRERGTWWGWSDVKRAIEFLFWSGQVTSAGRTTAFERRYAVPERVLPRAVLEAPTPSEADAQRELLRISARSLGVCFGRDLLDYFRLPVAAKALIGDLVEEGTLLPVQVERLGAAYLHRDARVPRRVGVATLVSPFDPLVWERTRTERLFGFRYRIGIYTPAAQRTHGYYALPFVLGDAIVARADLKADRPNGVLQVLGVWFEDAAPANTGEALDAELARLARWLGLSARVPERALSR